MKTVQASYDSTLTDVLASHTAEYREIIEARVNASWRAAWDEKEAFVQKLENGLVASTRRIAELETQIVDAKLFRASEHADRVAAEKRVVALEVQIRHERIDCDAWRTWARLLTGFAEGSTDGGMRSGVDSKIAELDVDRKSAWKSYHTAADERDTLCARLVSANEQLASTVALNHDWTVWAQELTGLVGVGGVAYREAIGARLADDFDWPAWVRKVIGFDNMPANRAREMIQEAVHECHEYTRWINNLQVDEICAGESFASARAKVGKLVEAVRAAKPVLTAEERRDVEYIRECAKADPTFWRHAAKLVPIFDRLCPPPKAPPSDADAAATVRCRASARSFPMAEFRTSALTPREQLTNLLANDARNLAYASRECDREVNETVTTDCAQRLVQAWDLGDPELTAQAERQLREAVALLGGGA